MLNRLRGQLNYASAIAILFEITNENDLTSIVKFERFLRGSGWASALAQGVDEQGRTLWANASRYRTATFAQETALEHCAKVEDIEQEGIEGPPAVAACELVIVNSEFQEKALMALADRLKKSAPAAAREAYLASITAAQIETFTPGGGGAMGNNLQGGTFTARVYTPSRK